MKYIRLGQFSEDQYEDFIRELQMLNGVKDLSIVKLEDYWFENDSLQMAFELCHHGNLAEVLARPNLQPGLEEPVAHFFIKKFVNAMIGLRYDDIIHRDVKLENLLVTNALDIKIADVGLAKIISTGSVIRQAGSIVTMAPEILESTSAHDFRSDIWSIGIVMYQLLFGTHPFYDNDQHNLQHSHQEILRKMREGLTFPPNSTVSQPARTLLKNIIRYIPEERLEI